MFGNVRGDAADGGRRRRQAQRHDDPAAAGRRSPSDRCYTGGCFIARFAAWPLRVTRLTEILIESETSFPLSAVSRSKERSNSLRFRFSLPFFSVALSFHAGTVPSLPGLSLLEERWKGKGVDPDAASLYQEKGCLF